METYPRRKHPAPNLGWTGAHEYLFDSHAAKLVCYTGAHICSYIGKTAHNTGFLKIKGVEW